MISSVREADTQVTKDSPTITDTISFFKPIARQIEDISQNIAETRFQQLLMIFWLLHHGLMSQYQG